MTDLAHSTSTGRGTVLVVDDTPANLEVLGALLAPHYEILFATSGLEALELARNTQPDLILLDIIMPEMDGFATCRQLKSQQETLHIPVIFVTALGDTTNETEGLRIGAVDFISKPFNPAVVKARIANHVQLKRQRDLLASLAWLDGLTGVANRRLFDEMLEREFRRAQRTGTPVALLMIDIDYFKQYNDHHGHLSGDDCLKKVIDTLKQPLKRPADMLFRYGGDEFSCLLPETPADGALQIARQMCDWVAGLGLPHPETGSNGVITVSIGVGSLAPQPHHQCADLLRLADQALYDAKAAGRNTARCLA